MTPDRAPARPAGGTGAPRGEGDGIAVDIATRAGLLTVVFTSPASASARPTGTAFSYRGRHYTGSVYLAGPSWRGTPGPGLSVFPAGSPAGPGVAATIADIIGAAVAAWLGDHPGILDLAAQAAAAAARVRAQRELELLQPEITAAGQHLEELRRKQHRLRAIAAGGTGSPPERPAATGSIAMYGAVAGVPVDVEVAGGELVITVWRYDPAAAGQLTIDPRFSTATLIAAVADQDGGTGRPGRRSYFDLYPDPPAGRAPEGDAQP